MANWNNKQVIQINNIPEEFVFVSEKSDLPAPQSGVITLLANTTYFFVTTVDLTWDRIVCGDNTTILWWSSENCRIKSTWLTTALITSSYSLPIRNITIEAEIGLDLNGDSVTAALDWFWVNFTDCQTIWTIKNYSNFIMADSAFLNSWWMTFDGTIWTIWFSQCLFNCNSWNTAIIIPSTITISRRMRIIYSSFIILSWEKWIDFNALASVPTEWYILDTVNFAGGGTYLSWVGHTSNKSLFIKCTWITNTAVNGQLYMQNNTTPTVISIANTFYKISWTTSPSQDNSKFIHSNNRLTCDAIISRKYLISSSVSFTSWTNDICEFWFYDSQLSGIRTPSRVKSTANASWRAENIVFSCVVTMKQGDYLEVHWSNTSSATNIVIEQMNFIITELA